MVKNKKLLNYMGTLVVGQTCSSSGAMKGLVGAFLTTCNIKKFPDKNTQPGVEGSDHSSNPMLNWKLLMLNTDDDNEDDEQGGEN